MPKWPHEDVPESSFFTYPDGPLTVKVKSQEDAETKNGKFAIKVETRVMEPKQFRNQPFNFMFVIGTEADPEAEEEETWTTPPSSYAAGRYKSYLKACGVPFAGDTAEEAENTPGNVIVIDVGHHETDEGKVYNDTNAFYSQQDAAGRTEDENEKPRGSKPKQVRDEKPAPKGAAKGAKKRPEPDDDDEGWDD